MQFDGDNTGEGHRFLAVVRCNLDDVPIRLCGRTRDAERCLRGLTREKFEGLKHDLGYDASGTVCGAVIEFDELGYPVGMEIRDLPEDLL